MSDNKLIKIYAYKNLITEKYVYVGQTILTLAQRAGKNGVQYRPCPYFWNEIQTYKWENFQGEILTTTTNKEYANLLEWFYTIELDTQYPNGCNSDIGRKRSREIKKRLSKAHIGKEVSEETRLKLSKSLKGNQNSKGCRRSDNTRKRMSESHIGKSNGPYSEETKRKMSEAHKGKPSSIKGSRWYTNGIENRRAFKCPFGFYLGKTIKRKV